MKNLLIILTILISSVVYGGGEGEYVSLKKKFMMEYTERCKTPYLTPSSNGGDTVDYQNFNEDLIEYLILKRINDYRVSNGRVILVEDTLMKTLSKNWSITMDSTSSFEHNPKLPASECILMDGGSTDPITYEDMSKVVFDVWRQSKGHNYVMLIEDEFYGSVGVSYSFKKCNEYTKSGKNLCEMFNLSDNYKMYVTFNSINGLGNL